MKKLKCITVILFHLLPAYCFTQNFGGNAPVVKWKQINTNTARVIFPTGLDSQANRMANVIQLLDSTTSNTIGGKQRKWNVVLQNQTTISNAYVRLAPVMSELYMTPPQDNFSEGSLRWDDNLIIHESRHMQQFSNFNKGVSKLFSFFLGQEGQLFANGLLLPDYFFEGDAVFQETLVSHQGRGRMPSFYNGFKSLWIENKKYSWSKYRSGSLKNFVPDHYPLGYMLVSYGYEKYGDTFWNSVTNDAVRGRRFFNKAIQKYSRIPFKQFRSNAIDYFKEQSALTDNKVNDSLHYITATEKNNVVDYLFPAFIGNDSIVVTKKSYKKIAAFYLLVNGKEEKIRVKDVVIDDYFSYRSGKIVYAAYQSDARWSNRDYSVIQLLDIATKKQQQLTVHSKYFSPDINSDGTEVLAVSVNTDGTNALHRLNAATGKVVLKVPNTSNYFFTQTKYINSETAIAAVRNPEGNMALAKVNLVTGAINLLTMFSFNVLGNPFVKGDTVYFSRRDKNADNIFAITLNNKRLFKLTNNLNGVYQPVVNYNNDLVYTAFTADGHRLVKTTVGNALWQQFNDFILIPDLYTPNALTGKSARVLDAVDTIKHPITKYKKSFQLFNFHSWRPIINDPEFGYTLYSDNVFSSFSNAISYTYNRNDKSHTIGFNSAFAGLFPILNVGVEESFNRTLDNAFGKSVQYNTALAKAGISIPLHFIGHRTNKFISLGGSYNIEQYYYNGLTKNVLKNKAINYINTFISFGNYSRMARQNINPKWGQVISLTYKDAFNFRESHKFIGAGTLYFPGLFANHSLVINTAYQKRDSLPDLFSNTFLYARGYQALSTRRMYKLAANYHFPIVYPDGGIPGLIYFTRIRANMFYDYNNAKARVNGTLTEIINRSVGTEIYFDTKIWNSLPVSIGVRFAHLLDMDLINPIVKNKWEILIPINLIPN